MAEEDDIPVRGETPGFACKADGMSAYVGRTATSDIGAAILAQSGARQLRWIPLGAAVTMDYRGDRVNVRLDGANAVTVVTCG
ncbi:MAG: hypothetical protein GW859_09605 [Sphingomonadales bacterium]|nr:hypothetical protein [Sphingomonadales bacterium]